MLGGKSLPNKRQMIGVLCLMISLFPPSFGIFCASVYFLAFPGPFAGKWLGLG
jgi:hypothetical protein